MTRIPTEPVPKLPSLDPAVTLLTADGRVTGALQSLVLDHLLVANGEALWVDAENNAATTALAKIAPSQRILDRIAVARAFTAFQHYSLVDDLKHTITGDTSLIVAPSVEWFYANGDLFDGEGKAMLEHTLGRLTDLSAEYDVPVLVSRETTCGLGAVVEEYAGVELDCVQTTFGPRFSGDGYETLVFECPGGVQTTLAFWSRMLRNRHPAQLSDEPQGVTTVGTY